MLIVAFVCVLLAVGISMIWYLDDGLRKTLSQNKASRNIIIAVIIGFLLVGGYAAVSEPPVDSPMCIER